jgi:hypothetical protein
VPLVALLRPVAEAAAPLARAPVRLVLLLPALPALLLAALRRTAGWEPIAGRVMGRT